MPQLRVALLGCGGIGARHAAAVKALDAEMRARRLLRPRPGEDASSSPPATAPRAFTDFGRMLDERKARTC